MGTKPEHLRLPENTSHEGWRKGRRAARGGEAAAPKDPRAMGWGKWRQLGWREQDHGLRDDGEQGHGGGGAAGTGLFTGCLGRKQGTREGGLRNRAMAWGRSIGGAGGCG